MNRNFFKCLFCGKTNSVADENGWTCSFCGRNYPAHRGIPLLVKDWKSHQDKIANLQRLNPLWYCQNQSQGQSFWHPHLAKRQRFIESSIQRYLVQSKKTRAENILDLGCGDGSNLSFLAEHTDGLIGCDYNPERILRAAYAVREKATLFLADILDLPVQDNFFEIIFCNHVIEHIREDIGALRSIHRILKPNGLLILGTPNEGALWWQVAYKLQPKSLKTTDHVNFYTAGSISAKMKQVGFAVNEIKHLGWGLPHWWLDRKLRKHKWVDDIMEQIGKRFFHTQASSLYLLATKQQGL